MPYQKKTCPVCNESFMPAHPRQVYCQKADCMRYKHNEQMKEYYKTHGRKQYKKR
jgi:hypothetical protein